MSTRVKVEMQPIQQILKNHGLDSNGRVQLYVTNMISRRMTRYMPFQSGALATKLIKSGQPVTNLTASAFNVFLDKLNLISGLTRTNIYDSYRVSSGDTITAAQFTRLRSALWFGFMYLEGRSSQNLNKLPNVRAGTTISAEILSTGEYSFKNALNKLIHAMRP